MTISNLPLPVQNTITRKALETVKVDDSVQFRPTNGGEPVLFKIDQIVANKRGATLPRLFVGQKNGKQILALETSVTRVITRSVDNEADWIDDKFIPED